MNDLETFKELYKRRLNDFCSRMETQLYGIIYVSSISKNIDKDKVCIKLRDENSCADVSFKNKSVTIWIGFNDVKILEESRPDMSIFDCFCKIVTHEYLHIIMGHMDSKIKKVCHRYANGFDEWSQIFFPYKGTIKNIYLMTENKRLKLKANPEPDPIIMNIAGDFEINQMINLKSPFLDRKEFGLPNLKSIAYYYAIIYNLLISYPKGEISNKYLISQGISSPISQFYAPYRDKIRKLYESYYSEENFNEFIFDGDGELEITNYGVTKVRKYQLDKGDSDELNGLFAGNQSSDLSKKFNITKMGMWADFRKILNQIKTTTNIQMQFISKEQNWTKFNNRREQSGFLLPGKIEMDGAMERKIKQHAVMMVDISASMEEVVIPLYTFCYFLLKNTNITLVFYDTKVKSVFTSHGKFVPEPLVFGGTCLKSSINDYESKYNKKITDLYVITDGYDDSIEDMVDLFKNKSHIYIINKLSIKERM